jgi:hypothetical protein
MPGDFKSLLHGFIPEVIVGQKYHKNPGFILSGYIGTDILNVVPLLCIFCVLRYVLFGNLEE